jgi:hypothetical protein
MKSKLTVLLIALILLSSKGFTQYKDLEGVFFGKVIGFAAGTSYAYYPDKNIKSGTGFVIAYNVHLNNKTISSLRFGLQGKHTSTINDPGFTQTNTFKLNTFDASYKYALTPDGTDQPTSLFFNIDFGVLWGKQKQTDSRYGETENHLSKFTVGGGLTLYQRLNERILVYLEPVYKIHLLRSSGVYVGDGTEVKFHHLSANLGLAFLIGKSQ